MFRIECVSARVFVYKDELTTIWAAAAAVVVVHFSETPAIDGKENLLNFQLRLNYVFKEPFIRSCKKYLNQIRSIFFVGFFFTNSESDKMYWWWTFLSILFCVLLTGHISMELYNQLQHLIDYVKSHTEAQQPDLMLGIYICEGD